MFVFSVLQIPESVVVGTGILEWDIFWICMCLIIGYPLPHYILSKTCILSYYSLLDECIRVFNISTYVLHGGMGGASRPGSFHWFYESLSVASYWGDPLHRCPAGTFLYCTTVSLVQMNEYIEPMDKPVLCLLCFVSSKRWYWIPARTWSPTWHPVFSYGLYVNNSIT